MSEEFSDKYALEVSQVHLFSIYTYICVLDFEATCDRETGKVRTGGACNSNRAAGCWIRSHGQ